MSQDNTEPAQVAAGPFGEMLGQAPHGSSIVFHNDPGLEAEPFLYEVAHHHLEQGRDVVMVLLNRSPSTVISEMAGLGYPPSDCEGRLVFVDAFSKMLGVSEDTDYRIEEPDDPDELVSVLEAAAADHPAGVLLVDSLSTWIDRIGAAEIRKAWPRLKEIFQSFQLTGVLQTDWPYENEVDDIVERFDAEVRIEGLQDRVLFGQAFRVERASWLEDASASGRHIFETKRPGGVRVYIPKIVVTGPYNSGKSTFVDTISDESVSVDRLGTTVALDHGHVELGGLSADVFGTPGQVRFDPILETVAGEALGVIVLVDATKPDTFERARELLEKTWSKGLPGVVAANKQDLPGALSAEEIADELHLEGRAEVVECVGQERDSAREVLERITDQILQGKVAP